MNDKKQFQLSASLICGNLLDLAGEIKKLEDGKIDLIHFDVMDGHFVPRLGFFPEVLEQIKTITKLPVFVHAMIDDAVAYGPMFVKAGGEAITVHAEAGHHLHRSIKILKDMGAKVGVGINPATPLSVLDYVLDDINHVMLMAINPGIVGHKLIPRILDKIGDLKEKLRSHPHVKIEVDGGVTPESAPQMVRRGADILVCGSSSIFKKGEDLAANIMTFRKHIENNI